MLGGDSQRLPGWVSDPLLSELSNIFQTAIPTQHLCPDSLSRVLDQFFFTSQRQAVLAVIKALFVSSRHLG